MTLRSRYPTLAEIQAAADAPARRVPKPKPAAARQLKMDKASVRMRERYYERKAEAARKGASP